MAKKSFRSILNKSGLAERVMLNSRLPTDAWRPSESAAEQQIIFPNSAHRELLSRATFHK